MKKLFAIIIALCMVAALFAGCAPAEPANPTEAPKATEEVKPTEAAEETPTTEPTEAPTPTPTPEPTPEPYPDPYKVEILDFEDAYGYASSFDTIFFDSKTITDGGVAGWKSENDETVDGTDGKIKAVAMRGWAGFEDAKMTKYGYQIDEGPVVFIKNAAMTTEPGVKSAGGEFANRFKVTIPVTNLFGKGHELKVVVLLETGEYVYLNNELGPFVLYYDGPEADADAGIDGVISNGEYAANYTLKASNAQTWTDSDIGSAVIDYYVSLKEDGVYVGIKGSGIAAGDMLQLNFNPGARLEEKQGLFISFVTGDALKVLQHNHKTVLKDDDNAQGADITDLVESKIVATEDGFIIEAKIPVDFFKVTDVENAEEFKYGTENLYFGMFAVLGGAHGYTNQSQAPGSDWTCQGLGLHEYYAY